MFNKRVISFHTLRNRKGMTLLEILAVLALLAMVFAFIGKNVWNRVMGGKRRVAKIYLTELKGALDNYKLDCNDYPKSLQALVENPGDCPAYAIEGYVGGKKIKKDPYNCDPYYSYEGGEMKLMSLGAQCQEGGEGEATDIPYEE